MEDVALPPADCKSEDGQPMTEGKGIEVGNIFQLGTHYSTRMARAVFTDSDGKGKPYYMGCYGIGIGRTMGTVVEVHNDDKGILWPKSVTPYHVHLISLQGGEKEAEKLYEDLKKAGIDVLYDDRDERPGMKFNDADLIGIPLRLVVSKRTIEKDGVEWKERSAKDSSEVKLSEVIKRVGEYYAY